MVIGLNLCPFAKKPFQLDLIKYRLIDSDDLQIITQQVIDELRFLERTPIEQVETTLIILPNTLESFESYWDYIGLVENLVADMDLEGILQIASFHPCYQFAGSDADDPANYSNRSPYPTIHLLREASLTKALENYPNPEQIPEKNIATLREMGVAFLRNLWKQ